MEGAELSWKFYLLINRITTIVKPSYGKDMRIFMPLALDNLAFCYKFKTT
jgi:hypothetical protein